MHHASMIWFILFWNGLYGSKCFCIRFLIQRKLCALLVKAIAIFFPSFSSRVLWHSRLGLNLNFEYKWEPVEYFMNSTPAFRCVWVCITSALDFVGHFRSIFASFWNNLQFFTNSSNEIILLYYFMCTSVFFLIYLVYCSRKENTV